jgi:hypothetical protein
VREDTQTRVGKEWPQTQEEREEWRRLCYKTIHTNERKSYDKSSRINAKVKLTISMERKIPFYYVKRR